jgi:hypothetical protein
LARIKATFPRIQTYTYWCVEEITNAYHFLRGVESDGKMSLTETWIRWMVNVEAGLKNERV